MCGKHRTGNRGLVALMLVAVGLLAGCGGNNADPAGRLDPAMPGQTAADNLAVPAAQTEESPAAPMVNGLPAGLPGDEYIDPAVIAARRGSVIELQSIAGDEVYAAGTNSIINAESSSITLAPSPGEPAWAIYRFSDLLPGDVGLMATVLLQSPASDDIYFGISNYGTGGWDWSPAPGPAANQNIHIRSGSHAYSLGGNLYLAIASSGTAGIGISEVWLRFDVLAPPPQELSADYDLHPSKIDLAWHNVPEYIPDFTYESVRIERRDSTTDWAQIAEVPAGVSEYSDISGPENELIYGREYSYRVKTVVSGTAGEPGESAVGRLMVPDVTDFAASDGTYPDGVLLTWRRIPKCDGYLIEIHHSGEWQELKTLDSGSYYRDWHVWDEIPLLTLEFDRYYDYRIKAIWDGETSFNYALATGRLALGPAQQLIATDGGYPDKVSVGWQAILHADGYELEYREGSSGDFLPLAVLSGYASRVFEHTHLAPTGRECAYDTVYEYRVRGTCNGETMPWHQAPVDSGHRLVQPPAMVSAADGSSMAEIEVSWSLPAGITEFKVYRDGVDPGNLVATISDGNTWTDPVSGYATHDYYIVSTWQGIDSAPSAPDSGFKALFQAMTISTESHYFISLAEVDGRPAVAASRQYEPGLHFYHSDAAVPTESGQWQLHNAFEDCSNKAGVSLVVFDNRPAVAVGQMFDYDHSIHYVRASTPSPAAVTEWTSHEIAPTGSAYNVVDMAAVNGVPAVTYYSYVNSWTHDQYYARAKVAEPGSPSDWATLSVPEYIFMPSLVECHGRPVLAGSSNYAFEGENTASIMFGLTGMPHTTGDWQPIDLGDAQPFVSTAMVVDLLAVARQSETAGVQYSRALTMHPATVADWESHRVDDCIRANGSDALVDIGGRPVLVYVKPIGSEYGLMVAAARTASPADAADWDIYRAATLNSCMRATLAEVDGHVALAWLEQHSSHYYQLRFAVSHVALPDGG